MVCQGGVANRRGAKDDAAQGGGRGRRRPKRVQQAQRAELRHGAAKGMPVSLEVGKQNPRVLLFATVLRAQCGM